MRYFLAALVCLSSLAAPQFSAAQEGKKEPLDPKKKAVPLGEWLDPNKTDANGATYKTFKSKVLGRDVSYMIYLPSGYEDGKQRYPVIYWLHGYSGNPRVGAMVYLPHLQEAVKQKTLAPAIVVFVNGMASGFYLDNAGGDRPIESIIIKDLIPNVDQTYRTIDKREARIVQGYSMGGFGAGHLGFKYPDLFGTVIVDAGAVMDFNWLPLGEHPRVLARKNADRLRDKTQIRIACGADDSLLSANKQLHELLDELKIPHQYEVVPGVAHNSDAYYKKLGANAFDFHQKALKMGESGK